MVSLAVALAICATSAVAFACPYCGGLNGLSPVKQLLIGALLLLPFLIVGTVAGAIRRAELNEAAWPPPRRARRRRAGAREGVS